MDATTQPVTERSLINREGDDGSAAAAAPRTAGQPAVRMETATEFVVVSFWQPKSSSAEGSYEHETFTDQRDAYDVFRDYERNEYPRARAVCIFASRHGVPIGRLL